MPDFRSTVTPQRPEVTSTDHRFVSIGIATELSRSILLLPNRLKYYRISDDVFSETTYTDSGGFRSFTSWSW